METARYYEKYGQGHDGLVRCSGCHKLVQVSILTVKGGCPKCGGRRVLEITTLKWWEWVLIRTGLLSFPYREEFLKEFRRERG